VAGGPGGRNCGINVVRVKVRAWNREKIMYGIKVIAIGFEVHQKNARIKYWTFSSSRAFLTYAMLG
jgi:hypothetical protein